MIADARIAGDSYASWDGAVVVVEQYVQSGKGLGVGDAECP